MKKLLDLRPLTLWGEYQETELWLEFNQESMIRIIVFVNHPQYFVYSSAARFKQTEGRKQDVLLSVAAKMAKIKIEAKFYELHHEPSRYPRLKKKQKEEVRRVEAGAYAQLQAAFPEKAGEIDFIAERYAAAKEKVDTQEEKNHKPNPKNQMGSVSHVTSN